MSAPKKNMRHTQAPWSIVLPDRTRPSQIGVAGCDGQVDIYKAPLTDETEDNAYLIAAAPELYAACQAALRAFYDDPEQSALSIAAAAACRDAVKKTQGE